jgi:hypothetical protein
MSAIRDELDRLEAMGLPVMGLEIVVGEVWISIEPGKTGPLGPPTHALVEARTGSDYFSVALWWAVPGRRPIMHKDYSLTLARPERRQIALGWLWMAALADLDATLAALAVVAPGRLRFGGRPK